VDQSRIRAALAAIAEQLEEEPASPTVRVLWERWADVHRGLEAFDTDQGRARHVLAFFGDKPAGTLAIADIDGAKGYRAQRLTKIRGGGPLRPATRNREVDLLNRVLNFAVNEDLIPRNPLAHAKPEPEDNIQHSKIESEAKLQALRAEADRPLMDALMVCLFETGARRKEVHTLRWDQLEGEWAVFPRTKSREPRRVKLTPRAVEALRQLPRFDDCPWIFANPQTRRRYNSRHLDRLFARVVDAAGLDGVNGERVTPHKFRHGFAYRARRVLRLPQATVMRMQGHKTDSAHRRYGITDEEETDEAWSVVALSGASNKTVDRKPPQRVPLKAPADEELHHVS